MKDEAIRQTQECQRCAEMAAKVERMRKAIADWYEHNRYNHYAWKAAPYNKAILDIGEEIAQGAGRGSDEWILRQMSEREGYGR